MYININVPGIQVKKRLEQRTLVRFIEYWLAKHPELIYVIFNKSFILIALKL